VTSSDYAAMAARVLKHKSITERPSALSRDRGIAIVAQAMKESTRAHQRRRLWLGSTLLATAAAAAIVLVALRGQSQGKGANPIATRATAHHECGSPTAGCVAPTNASSTLEATDIGHSEGREIMPGGVIQADAARPTHVEFDSGTRIALGSNTMLGYDEGSTIHRFSLSRGSVHLEVAKLKLGQRFLLNTVDTEVEVRGTVFDVVLVPQSKSCQQRTSVRVSEGVVEVRSAHELRTLRHGEAWQGECVNPPAEAALSAASTGTKALAKLGANEPRQPAFEANLAGADAEHARVDEPVEAARLSDLAKQNDIYARASTERNQGHVAEALSLYSQLMTKFPTSALVESALVQRIRILEKSSHTDAVREAKQYLTRFPKGFARDEFEHFLHTP